jgi:hypothetical protein
MILTIDNQTADVNGSIIELTKQWVDFSELNNRYLGRTNRIILPRTDNNIRIFGRPCLLGSDNRPFEKYYRVNLIDDTIIFSGIGKMTEANMVFTLDVTENTKTFFDNINVNLDKLDFEQYDFTYNSTAYNNLKLPSASPWIWPVSSMHENKKNNNFLFSTTQGLKFNRPFFLIPNLITEILSSQGWTLEIDDQQLKFPFLILSSNHERFYFTDYQKTLTQTINGNGSLTNLDVNDFEESTVVTTSTTIDIKQHEAQFRIRGNVSVTSEYKIIVSGASSPSGDDTQDQEIIIRENDTYVDFTTNVFKITSTDTSNIISISVEGTGSITFENTLLYTIIEEATLGDFSSGNFIDFYVKTHDNLPDFTQLSLLQNIWKLFGVGFISDSFNKKITAFSFRRLNKNDSVDWSDKFIADTELINGAIGNYAQTNYFKYSNDDTIDETTGEESFEIANETLKDESDIIVLDYSASNEVVINSYTLLDMEVYTDTERANTLTQRIGLYYLDPTDTFSLAYFNPIDWSVIAEDNYLNVVQSLQRTRFVTARFVLNNKDFIGFNPTKPAYIEQLQGKYIIQRINNYIPNVPVECELLKLE